MSTVFGVTRNAWLLSRTITGVPGSTRITRPVTSAVWAIAAVVTASARAATKIDIGLYICRCLPRSSNETSGSKDAATECRSRRARRAPRRDEITGDRENWQSEADQRIGDARDPAGEITVVETRDPVPRCEPRLITLLADDAARFPVDDHGAGGRLDANDAAIGSDESGGPRPGYRGGGVRREHVGEAGRAAMSARRAGTPRRR